MSWDFSDCRDLAEILARIEARRCALHASRVDEEAEFWRLSVLARTLRALAGAYTLADRGVLLREAVRLCDDRLTLPLTGLALEDAGLADLDRFDLACRVAKGLAPSATFEALRLSSRAHVPTELLEEVLRMTRLDPWLRRPRQPDIPDGVLLRLTAYDTYQNPTQKAAVRALVTMPPSGTLLTMMPTGAGKSLLFQLGVRWWREQADVDLPCAVVVVPTVALALDHQETLRGLPGLEGSAALVGSMSNAEKTTLLERFRRGEVPVLLMAPEAAFGSARDDLLRATRPASERHLAERGRLTGVFIDEAHVIHTWGRTFRPDFQRLAGLVRELRSRNANLRVVLLSATVDIEARSLLEQQYANGGPFLAVSAGCPRTELDLIAHAFDSRRERDDAVLQLLDVLPRPAIVYTTEVAHAEALGRSLRQHGYGRMEVFTGDTQGDDRSRIVRRWRTGDVDLVIATSAFGMGIDKRDVRAVVHACLPESVARYYQEIGRAGRDGHQATSLLLYARDELHRARTMDAGQLMLPKTAAPRWWALVEDCRARGTITYGARSANPVLTISLTVAPSHLTSDPDYRPGSHNRRWNASLLNQLQRYRIIEVQSVEDERDAWTVALREPALLDDTEASRARVLEILAARADEQQETFARFHAFAELLRDPKRTCLLVGVFGAIEPGGFVADPCGRCPSCRSLGLPPPVAVRFSGTGAVWMPDCADRTRRWRVIEPETPEMVPSARLLARLTQTGIRQFIVPDEAGPRTARLLADLPGTLGLVLEWRHVLEGWGVAKEATAVVAVAGGPRAEALYEVLETLADPTRLGRSSLFIVASDFRSRGLRIADCLQAGAPIRESWLDDCTGVMR